MSNKTTGKRSEKTRQVQRHVEWLTVNQTRDEGARGLGEALKTNTTLTALDLDCQQPIRKTPVKNQASANMWRDRSARFGAKGVRALCGALKTNTTLSQLNLKCEPNPKIAQRKTSRMKRIVLMMAATDRVIEKSRLGEELLEALQSNTALTKLMF